MALTKDDLVKIFPGVGDPDIWAAAINAAWEHFGITSKNARAGYLGICANETGAFREVRRENMNYSYQRAAAVWPRKAGGTMQDRCAKGPQAFANWVYAGIIGNGDETSGDGWRYRGGGIIQLTGRANYRAAGKGVGIDLEASPESVTDPATSAAVAAWFMARYVNILPLLDSGSEDDFLAGARKVGLPADEHATQRRLDYRRKALEVVLPAGVERRDDGNVVIKDLRNSTIIKDSNKGLSVGSVAATAGAAAPVITAAAGMDWKLAAVLGVVVLLAGAGALYYFTKVKRARRQMFIDNVA